MRKFLSIIILTAIATFGFSQSYKDYFQKYVALGDSLTAGFQDGGLVDYYQKVSFPALIAKQAGARNFALPLISPPGIPPLLKLTLDAKGNITVIPTSYSYGHPENLTYPAPYNDLGIPGATTYDMLSTVTDGGGFHDIILRGLGTQLQEGIALSPKIITLWIGNNDVLGAVISGRVIEGSTIVPLSYFKSNMEAIVGALKTSTSAKIVMITIPKITLIPYTTYIKPYITVNGQKVYLIGPKGQLTDNDLVLLSAMGDLNNGYGIPAALGGTGLPLPDEDVLDSQERKIVENRVKAFNSEIKSLASKYNIALFDSNKLLEQASNGGITVGGITLTSEYITGGLFSLDGVHPSTIGYALIANELIKLMNKNFSWDIPLVDVAKFMWSSPRPASSMSGKHLSVAVSGLKKIFK